MIKRYGLLLSTLVLLTLLVVIHIAVIRLQGVSELKFAEDEEGEKPKTFSFFPDHLLTEIMIGLALMVLLTALATIFPAYLGPKADPLSTPEVIKPE